jgi:hypothetical protein
MGKRRLKNFIAAAAFVAAQWQPAQAQTILGVDPGGVSGRCWQENTNGEQIFRSGACKLKAGSLSIDRMTLDTSHLSCVFDSGTASEQTLNMRLLCNDFDEKQPSMYGAQLRLRSGKKIARADGSTVIEARRESFCMRDPDGLDSAYANRCSGPDCRDGASPGPAYRSPAESAGTAHRPVVLSGHGSNWTIRVSSGWRRTEPTAATVIAVA